MADAADAILRAWAGLAKSWIDGANEVMVSMLDMAEVESRRRGFNRESVRIPEQPEPTELKLGDFSDSDGNRLPADALRTKPQHVEPGRNRITVRVTPPAGFASGTYCGSVWDSSGTTCLVEQVNVYVVGDRLP